MANLANLMVGLGIDAGPFQNGLGKASQVAEQKANIIKRSFDGLNKFVRRSFANMGDEMLAEFGIRGFDQMIAAVKGLATATIGAAGDFESGMNRFTAVAGAGMAASGMSVEQFGDLFLEMGQKTQYSAAQAQEAAINMAKGGIDPATIAVGGLEQALGLAAAGELDLATSADIMAKQMGVWVDTSASAADKTAFLASTADLMASAANASTVGVEDLALGLANAGGSAKVAGFSFQETVTTMAQLAPGFSSAADAGTSFKAFIAGLIPDTKRQKDAMDALNLTTETGASRFYDASGSFIGMEKAAELLYQQTKDLSQEQKSLAFQTIFGADAIRAAAIIAEKGGDAYANMADDIESMGAATQQAAKRQKGWNFVVEQIQGSLETLSIVVGTALIPKLTDLAENAILPAINGFLEFSRAVLEADDPMNEFVARIDDAMPGFQTFIDVMGTIGGVISDNFVPAMNAAAGVITLMAIRHLPVLIGQIVAATTAWTGYGVAMGILAAGPFVLLAGAIFLATKRMQALNAEATIAIERQDRHNETMQGAIAVQGELAAFQGTQPAAMKDIADRLDDEIAKRDELAKKIYLDTQAGLDSQPRYRAFMEERRKLLAEMESGIDATSQALHDQIVAQEAANWTLENSNRLVPDYITGMHGVGGALREVQDQVGLTADQLEELDKALEETAKEIPQAFADMTNGVIRFYGDIQATIDEKEAAILAIYDKYGGQKAAERSEAGALELAAVETAYKDQLNAAVVAHADELAEQRRHLGEMLLARVEAFASDPANNIAAEQAEDMSQRIRDAYGLVQSKSDEVFSSMPGIIDAWAANVNRNASATITDLGLAEASAESLRLAEEKLTGEFRAQFIHDFEEGRLSASELAVKISQIPTLVRATLEHNYWDAMKAAEGVSLAVRSVPTVKLVRIEAMIDGNLERRSPAPIEKVMSAIDEFASRSHMIRVGADIDDQLVRHSPAPIEGVLGSIEDFASRSHTIALQAPTLRALQTQIQMIQSQLDGLTEVRTLNVQAPIVDASLDRVSGLQKPMAGLESPILVPVGITNYNATLDRVSALQGELDRLTTVYPITLGGPRPEPILDAVEYVRESLYSLTAPVQTSVLAPPMGNVQGRVEGIQDELLRLTSPVQTSVLSPDIGGVQDRVTRTWDDLLRLTVPIETTVLGPPDGSVAQGVARIQESLRVLVDPVPTSVLGPLADPVQRGVGQIQDALYSLTPPILTAVLAPDVAPIQDSVGRIRDALYSLIPQVNTTVLAPDVFPILDSASQISDVLYSLTVPVQTTVMGPPPGPVYQGAEAIETDLLRLTKPVRTQVFAPPPGPVRLGVQEIEGNLDRLRPPVRTTVLGPPLGPVRLGVDRVEATLDRLEAPTQVDIAIPSFDANLGRLKTLQAELYRLTEFHHVPIDAPQVVALRREIQKTKDHLDRLREPVTIPVSIAQVGDAESSRLTKEPAGAAIKEPAATGGSGSVEAGDPQDIARKVGEAVTALQKLRVFDAPSREAMDAYARTVAYLTQQFNRISSEFTTEALEQTGHFADTAGKAVGTIGTGVDNFRKLDDYQAVSEVALRDFVRDLRLTVSLFNAESRNVEHILDDQSARFADMASKTVAVIGSGIDAFDALRGYEGPSQSRLYRFVADLGLTVYLFDKQAASVEAQLTERGERFADVVGKSVSVIGGAVDGFAKLDDYRGVPAESLKRFVTDLGFAVWLFWAEAQDTLDALDTSTTQFADVAGKSVAVLGSGIEAFEKLDDYRGVAVEPLKRLVSDLGFAVWLFWAEAQDTLGAVLDDIGPKFADQVSKIVGTIGDGVEAFDKLKNFQDVPRERLVKLMEAIGVAVSLLSAMSSQFERDGTARTAEFAEAVSKILAPINDALSAFDGLKEYEDVPADRMRAIASDMYEAYYLMAEIARGATAEGIQSATVFSEALTLVFQAMKGGIEALTALREYEGVPPERFQAFLSDMWGSLALMQQIAGLSGTIQDQAEGASTAMNAVSTALKNGTDALAAIRSYENVPSERIAAFLADIIATVGGMTEAARQAGVVQTQAGEWETQLGRAADAIRAGLDSINALDGLTASATVNAAVNINGSGNGGDPQDKTFGGFTGFEHLAVGTRDWTGGVAMVGERGPELVELPESSRVHTTAQTKGILRNSMAPTGPQTVENHVHLEIDRVDNEELVEVLVDRVARKLAELSRK